MIRFNLPWLCLIFWTLFQGADLKRKAHDRVRDKVRDKVRDRSSHDRIVGGDEAEHAE